MDWSKKVVLITGGTGSFGKKFIEMMLAEKQPAKLIVYSRDELKQHDMRQAGFDHPSLRYFLGDIRDKDRMKRACEGVDIVVHAAALKQVPACEYNPMEAIKTNILGSSNVVDAALDTGVEKVLALSTDKAVNPVNLYGATKLAAEKLIVQSNAYAGGKVTRLSCVRYGNVVGSRGSVVPVFLKQRQNGRVTVTDERMTRFWLTLDQGVHFVIRSLEQMHGGEVFVPKIPSMAVMDLARAVAPENEIEIIGIRPGEKLHEVLISEDESRHTRDMEDMYVIMPAERIWQRNPFGWDWEDKGTALEDGYRYASNNNPQWLTVDEIREMIRPIEVQHEKGTLGVKTLLVTGASGLLGVNLCLDAQAAGRYHVVGQVNHHGLRGAPFATLQADLARPGEFSRVLAEVKADFVVHTAALANLDACEKDPRTSARLNAELPGEVAEACRRSGARLAHLSTDSVFDGEGGGYREDDPPNPQGVYARDKLAGERAVQAANPEAVIARVNFYGWSLSGRRSLAEFFYGNLSAGKAVNGFTDVLFCPLVANQLGEILLEMLEKGLSGVYHALSSEHQSKYAFGVALAHRFGLDENLVTPISVAESGLVARRSPNLTMRVDKLEAALGRAMPGQAEGLERLYALWAAGRAELVRGMEG